jgi:hypothetical protein
MATENPIFDISDLAGSNPPGAPAMPGLLVVLAPMLAEHAETIVSNLTSSFPAEELIIATPDAIATEGRPGLRVVASNATNASWTLTAADFVSAYRLAQENEARAVLLLGPGSETLQAAGLRDLADAVLSKSADLAVPHYDLPARAGLINSAILYPLTRALFSSRVRFPLAIDLGLSLRMAERLAVTAQRFTAVNQDDALLWPIDEAAVAGLATHEVDVGHRATPQPSDPDLNAILASVTGSIFADIDAKAAFWQRQRILPPARDAIPAFSSAGPAIETGAMLDAFRLAYTNLQEIWSLVLPPNSLLGLKRIYGTDGAAFRMPDSLWARIVFDFLVAYRLRTINRRHLLGALIPLYLAWVASHLNITASGTNPERHIEAVAAAFEADKPYLVARWRWPDRFNP